MVIPRGPLAGWSFASGGGQPGYLLGASEPDLQDALVSTIQEGDVVYDIGANVGFFALLAARLVSPAGRVYAFEPMDSNVPALARNFALNDVRHAEVVRSAVSDAAGPVRMSLGNNQATGHLADDGDDLVTVGSTTVDAFVAAGNRPPDLVKIDVEGAEDRVLAGMVETLGAYRPTVLCELHYGREDPRREAITKILSDAGYTERELPLDGGSMPHLLATPRKAGHAATRVYTGPP
jgi:FkbM family methyltransferase